MVKVQNQYMKRIPLLAMTLTVLTFSACNRTETDREITSAADNALADTYYNDMYAVVTSAAADNDFAGLTGDVSNNKETSSDCPAVSFSAPLGTFPNTMTIDFGTGCTGYYGIERSGKINATFTAAYKDSDCVITIVPEDYTVQGAGVEGVKTITNLGINTAGNMHFSVVVTDAKITLTGGQTIQWNSTRDREWLEGISTALLNDDVYLITGGAEGINRDELPFTMTITSAIRKEMDCRWILSGIVNITPEGIETRTINYGSGTCDNTAILTVGDFTTEITLGF